MATIRAVTTQSGRMTQIQDANSLGVGGGIERNTAGTLVIGGNATSTGISLGSVGVTTSILGDLSVAGAVNTIGGTTFSTDATFEGNVTFGDAAADTVAFTAGVGPSGNQDLHFVKELAHVIDVTTSTTAATAGGALTIRSGAGNGAAGGAFTLDTGTGSAGGALTIGGTNAASVGIGRSGITTTVTGGLTQLTGAVSLSGNAASSLTTSAGALTLTSAAAATWSTAAGVLTVTGTGGLNLGAAAATLNINAAGTAAVIQAGATLSTTGTGNISLPNNASARFNIEGVAVSANVTAANLGTLTAGPASNADALHTHALGGVASTVAESGTAGATLAVGQLLAYDDATGPKLVLADANGGTELVNAIGFCSLAAASSGDPTTVVTKGKASVPDAYWDSLPGTGAVGQVVYMSETAGKVTLTAPSGSGSTVQKVGIVAVGGTGAVMVSVQIGDGVTLA